MKIYRLYQSLMRFAACVFRWREPRKMSGEGALNALKDMLATREEDHIFIVSDTHVLDLAPVGRFIEDLSDRKTITIFDKVEEDPDRKTIEAGVDLYREQGADMLIAIGGGSVIDTAKALGTRITRPSKPLHRMQGVWKVKKKLPFLIAVPTTAGTGSEVSITAVVKDREENRKYTINDHALIPDIAVLDPALTKTLPPHMVAFSGMDALTHAVEARISRSGTKGTDQHAERAVKGVFRYLERAYSDNDAAAREGMLEASYQAGLAFRRAYVGNVHALAHAVGAFYEVPHGKANAVFLPLVLRYYGELVSEELALLADTVGLPVEGLDEKKKADAFIEAIKGLNRRLGIPKALELPAFDPAPLAEHAFKEANPFYPVPRIFSREDFVTLFMRGVSKTG